MDTWILPAVIVALFVLAIWALIWRRREQRVAAAEYFGPLPEGQAEDEDISTPAQSGQVTPGAVTPGAAGSTERYYRETGVGRGGPEHIGGPPPEVIPERERFGASTPAWTDTTESPADRMGMIGFGVGAAAAAAIAVLSYLRWRARRQTRVERLRRRASNAASVARTAAGTAAVAVGGRATSLSGNVARRTPPAARVGLLSGLALLMMFRRRAQRREEARRLAMELQPPPGLGPMLARLMSRIPARGDGAVRFGPGELAVRERLAEPTPSWAMVASAGLAVLTGVIVWRSVVREQPVWLGDRGADRGRGADGGGGVPASP